jgi:hypothetical protein
VAVWQCGAVAEPMPPAYMSTVMIRVELTQLLRELAPSRKQRKREKVLDLASFALDDLPNDPNDPRVQRARELATAVMPRLIGPQHK